jgi:hypothetical protein
MEAARPAKRAFFTLGKIGSIPLAVLNRKDSVFRMARLDLQQQLITILGQVGSVSAGYIPSARNAFTSSFIDSVVRPVYMGLGGVLDQPPMRPGAWDLVFDGIAVELDEALHFNRYRAQTLESGVYLKLPAFPLREYQRFCTQREMECIQAGSYLGKWTNDSTAKQFGEASAAGDHGGNGATRWKQRALYDFLKDAIAVVTDIRVARISVWDVVRTSAGSLQVTDLLREPPKNVAPVLKALVEKRAGGLSTRSSG